MFSDEENMDNKKLTVQTALQAIFAYYWCIFLVSADSYYSPYFMVAIVSVIHAVIRITKKQTIYECFGRNNRISLNILSLFLSLTVVLANYALYHAIVSIAYRVIAIIMMIIGGFVIFRELIVTILNTKGFGYYKKIKDKRKLLIIGWIVIVFVDLFILIMAQYPGVITPDSISQIRQILTGEYSNHHPFYHTQIIRIFIKIGMSIFNNINIAVFLFSVFQILYLALTLIYIVKTVWDITKNDIVAIVLYIWYLIMPVNIMYSFYMGKDVAFGTVVVYFVISIYKYLKRIGNKKLNILIMVFSSFGICLLRSNGLFVYVFSCIVFTILFFKQHKKIVYSFLAIIVTSLVLKYPVLNALNVTQPDTIESLSIPAQQIARVIADGKELSEEQTRLISEVVDIDKVSLYYVSYFSDPIKDLVKEKDNQDYIMKHKFEYIKAYVEIGFKYPQKYIEAWIDQTKGYWNGGYAYWRWSDSVSENSLGIVRTTKSSFISSALNLYLMEWQGSPIFTLFLSIGIMTWAIFIFLYKAIIYKNKELVFILTPLILVLITLCMATPVYAEYRYIYSVSLCFPFTVSLFFLNSKQSNGK